MDKAVFLDRDGTVSEEIGYIRPEDMHKYALIPGAAEAIKRLAAAGYKRVLVTNQSGVARGYYPESQVHAVHTLLRKLLQEQGASLDGIYYCPHHAEPAALPDNGIAAAGAMAAKPVAGLCVDCDCRKPKPGMVLQAASELGLDLKRSWVIGDKGADLGLARNAGCRGILVLTGYGERTLEKLQAKGEAPEFIAKDLGEAVDIILKNP